MEFFLALFRMVMFAILDRWYDDVAAEKVSPFNVSSVFFMAGLALMLLMLKYQGAMTKFCLGVLGFHLFFVSAMYLTTNDHKEYNKGAGAWISVMTRCLGITGFCTLAMDYSNTKNILYPFAIGYAAAVLSDVKKMWSNRKT